MFEWLWNIVVVTLSLMPDVMPESSLLSSDALLTPLNVKNNALYRISSTIVGTEKQRSY